MKKGKDFQWSHFWSNSSIFKYVNLTTTVKVLINNRKLFIIHTVLRSSFSFHSFHTSFYNNCVCLLNKVKCLKRHICTSTHFTTPSIESRQFRGVHCQDTDLLFIIEVVLFSEGQRSSFTIFPHILIIL